MYGKYFASTFTGSMFGAGPEVFAVWGYVIANTVNSTVELNPVMLAAVLGSTPEKVESAITFLCRPDPASRNKDREGARLVHENAFQYHVVSHALYRAIRNEDDRREYNRTKQAESRARRKKTKVSKQPVIDSQSLSAMSAHTEAEADTEAKEQKHSPNPRKRVSEAQRKRDKKKKDSPPTKTDFAKARHTEFKAGIFEYWRSRNQIDCPWGPAEGQQLEIWLRANPTVTFGHFKQMLRNRYVSEVTHGDRPAMWIKNVTSYANGPIDQYGRPLRPGGNNGTGKNNQSPASQRVKANRQVLAEIAIKRGLYTPPGAFESDGEPLPESGFDGCDAGVRGGFAETDPEILPPESRNGG